MRPRPVHPPIFACWALVLALVSLGMLVVTVSRPPLFRQEPIYRLISVVVIGLDLLLCVLAVLRSRSGSRAAAFAAAGLRDARVALMAATAVQVGMALAVWGDERRSLVDALFGYPNGGVAGAAFVGFVRPA